MTPRKFCERPAEEKGKQVALTGHLGAAQVRRAQTWLSSSPRTGGGTSSLLLWIALSGGGLQVEEKPGALLLLLLELESATINPRSELHRPPTRTFLCASSTTVFLCSPLHTRAHAQKHFPTHTHTRLLWTGVPPGRTLTINQCDQAGGGEIDAPAAPSSSSLCLWATLLLQAVVVVMVVVSNPRRWGSHMTQPAAGWVKTTAVATVSNAALRKVQKKETV